MNSFIREVDPDDDATVAVRLCPKCGHAAPTSELIRSGYRCPACDFELAYLDITVGGSVRGVLGWVKREGEIVQGRYRITSVLGRGGFGTTYLVQDLQLSGKRRALKEIPEPLFDEAEAALLSRLDHPSIPDIIDRIVQDGMIYLVLEFGGTRTLASERKRLGGRIPWPALVPLAHQLCKVLSFLHAQSPPIIHRDLKPDNILLDDQDHVMLIDFGIAKLANPLEATRTLGRAVSFGFSAPEQIMGTGTNQRSDIYSLGATLYFLLAGVHPPALNAQLAGKKLEPLSKFLPDLPAALDKGILRALENDPERRQQSVDELARTFDDLERTLPRRPAEDTQRSRAARGKNLWWLVALLTVMAALLGSALVLWRLFPNSGTEPPPPTAKPALPGPDAKPPTATSTTPQPSLPPVAAPPPTEPTSEPPATAAPQPAGPAPPEAERVPASPPPPVAVPAPPPAPEPKIEAKPELEPPKEAISTPVKPPDREMAPAPKPDETEPPRPPPKVRAKSASAKPSSEKPRPPAEKPKAPPPEPDWGESVKSFRYEGARRTTP